MGRSSFSLSFPVRGVESYDILHHYLSLYSQDKSLRPSGRGQVSQLVLFVLPVLERPQNLCFVHLFGFFAQTVFFSNGNTFLVAKIIHELKK